MRIKNTIFLIFTAYLLSGCGTTNNMTGFETPFHSDNSDQLSPISGKYKYPNRPKLNIPDIADKTIIIWNHGTENSWDITECTKSWNLPPEIIQSQANKNTYIYFLCSTATDAVNNGTYTNLRAKEIKHTLTQLSNLGVNPKNIFLSGISAGAWSSMLLNAKAKKLFNAGIYFSPACCRTKLEQSLFGDSDPYNKMQLRQIKKFNTIPQTALIFTFTDDPYITKDDLAELQRHHPKSIKIKQYSCGKGHDSAYQDCKTKTITNQIKNYIKERKLNYKK